jgi:ppGpp synthetase/RelA/SpoT-type nucleotidyltranferase
MAAVEDRLRAEYFELLPDMRRVVEELEAEVRHCLLPMSRGLERHEQLVVKSRVKECESAIDALRRDLHEGRTFGEGRTFDPEKADSYTLKNLTDLAGVRVLLFPRNHVAQANEELRGRFPSWILDPIRGYDEAKAYYGYCEASELVRGEIQIVPMLTGLFWEVEHAAIYKPSPRLVDLTRRPIMQQRVKEVLNALESFEDEFEKLIRAAELNDR